MPYRRVLRRSKRLVARRIRRPFARRSRAWRPKRLTRRPRLPRSLRSSVGSHHTMVEKIDLADVDFSVDDNYSTRFNLHLSDYPRFMKMATMFSEYRVERYKLSLVPKQQPGYWNGDIANPGWHTKEAPLRVVTYLNSANTIGSQDPVSSYSEALAQQAPREHLVTRSVSRQIVPRRSQQYDPAQPTEMFQMRGGWYPTHSSDGILITDDSVLKYQGGIGLFLPVLHGLTPAPANVHLPSYSATETIRVSFRKKLFHYDS